jgi:hypothetical protein
MAVNRPLSATGLHPLPTQKKFETVANRCAFHFLQKNNKGTLEVELYRYDDDVLKLLEYQTRIMTGEGCTSELETKKDTTVETTTNGRCNLTISGKVNEKKEKEKVRVSSEINKA